MVLGGFGGGSERKDGFEEGGGVAGMEFWG